MPDLTLALCCCTGMHYSAAVLLQLCTLAASLAVSPAVLCWDSETAADDAKDSSTGGGVVHMPGACLHKGRPLLLHCCIVVLCTASLPAKSINSQDG
jgi:hypothetical protein